MRVIFTTAEYVTEKSDGGLSNYLFRVATALAKKRFDVHVITLSDINNKTFADRGVTVHRLKTGWVERNLIQLSGGRLTASAKWIDFSIQVYRLLRKLNHEEPIDIIQHSNYGLAGLVSTALLNIPSVLRLSSYRPIWEYLNGTKENLDSWLVEKLEEALIRKSPFVYAPSYRLRSAVSLDLDLYNIKILRTPCKIEVNPEDWNWSIYQRHLARKKYVLFFGRPEKRKGFEVLLEALPAFLSKFPDAYFVCIGQETSLVQDLLALRSDYGERIIYLNPLSHHELYPIISRAVITVHPSLIDNLPNSVLESMLLKTVVVGTRGSSINELISDGFSGFLSIPGDATSLSESLCRAWSVPDPHRISETAFCMANGFQFSFNTTIDDLVLTLETQAIQQRRKIN